MIIKELKKKHYKYIGGTKYFIDCSQSQDYVIPKEILKNKNDVSIISAIFNYSEYLKKNKRIVIKIGDKNKTNKKEYDYSMKLKTIPGFIQFVCLFDCFDDTYNYIKNNKEIPNKICTANNIGDNDKYVLVSSYYDCGSIKNYNWTLKNVHILKSLLKQACMSLMYAYMDYGFLHNDLHLDNVLFKKTKAKSIKYRDIDIESNGYKIIIMDFDLSFMNVDRDKGIEFFWKNLLNFFSRLSYDLPSIRPFNNIDIINIVENNHNNNKDISKTFELLHIIDKLEFKTNIPVTSLVYDPNV